MSNIEKIVDDRLAACGVVFTTVLVERSAREDNADHGSWEFDRWQVAFSSNKRTFSLEFRTGTGLRKKSPHGDKPQPPSAADVLHSVALSDPHGASFDDWCADYGFSSDSRKALDTFLLCGKHASEAKKIFGPAVFEELSEVLADF